MVLGLFNRCTRRPAQDAVSLSFVKQRMPADVCGESVRQPQKVSYGKSIYICVCVIEHLQNAFNLKKTAEFINPSPLA